MIGADRARLGLALLLTAIVSFAHLPVGAEDSAEARALLDDGEYLAALKAARRVLTVEPGNAEAHFIAGVASLKLERRREAERHLNKTLRVAPETPDAGYHLGTLIMSLADGFKSKGKERMARDAYEEALGHFEHELTLSPDHAGALEGRALALREIGGAEAAIEAGEEWVEADPESAEGHAALQRLYVEQGRSDDAKAVVERMPEAEPEQEAEANYSVARALYGEDRATEARQLLDKIREKAPGSWQVLGLEALDHLSADRPELAAEALAEFLRLGPPDTEIEKIATVYHEKYQSAVRDGRWAEGSGEPGSLSPPKLLQRLVPVYPKDARRYRVEGRVLLLVPVRDDGSVGELSVISTYASKRGRLYEPQFEKAALDAVRQWRYAPARKGGKPIGFPITVSIDFSVE